MVKPFSDQESSLSSAWRELKSLHSLYVESGSDFKNCQIIHLTDNKAVESIMVKGSSKSYLQLMALAIYKACKIHGIVLSVVWKSRSDPRLALADDWSRFIDKDDWRVDNKTFFNLEKRSGKKFEVDLFATDRNNRCGRFFSILASEQAEGRNAFQADWGKLGNVFACPPAHLVGQTLRHFVGSKARGGMIFPLWRSNRAWPLIAGDGIHLNRLFSNVKIEKPILTKGRT